MNLPNDVARCDGKVGDGAFSREGADNCFLCLRRTVERPRNELLRMMMPPEFIDGKCPERMTE